MSLQIVAFSVVDCAVAQKNVATRISSVIELVSPASRIHAAERRDKPMSAPTLTCQMHIFPERS